MTRPRKRFGQHFLTDSSVIERIITAVSPRPDDHVVEIGPGRGALTDPLLASGCRLTVVEIDRDLARSWGRRDDRNLQVVCADALTLNYHELAADGPVRLVGNLPYNISTPLLFRFIAHLDAISDLHLMLQREVGARIAAAPGGKAYGRLTVGMATAYDIEQLFEVAPESFHPPPRVHSTVLRLRPHSRHSLSDAERGALDQVLVQAFSRRRKTLRNALRGVIDTDALRSLNVDPQLRPEDLSPSVFVAIARRLVLQSAAGHR